MKIRTFLAITLLISGGGTAPVSASFAEAINGLSPGEKYRVLFVTTSLATVATNLDPSSSDIEFYDAIVAADAATGSVTGSLGLTWKALASTTTVNAQTHAGISNSDVTPVKIFNTVGQLVASSGSDFFHPVPFANAPRIEDQNGAAGHFFVATGTLSDGATNSDSPLGNNSATTGDSVGEGANVFDRPEVRLEFNITRLGTAEFGGGVALYGLSAIATTPIPLPAAIWLFATALGSAALRRRV